MNFSAILNVFKRELAAYFNAAIAYIFIIVFVLLSTSLFMTNFFVIGLADMRYFYALLPFILSVFIPAVTMRLWAEEKRGNTLELLLTFPMKTHALVLGKFFASLVFYLAALAGTLMIPIMLMVLGKPDVGQLVGGYLGAVLLGAFFLSIGIFISGFCQDQIVAFILAMLVCFGIHLIGTDFIAAAIDSWLPGIGSFLQHLVGSSSHFDSFAKGIIDNRDLLYFILGTVIFLTLNGFWLEGRMKVGAKKVFTLATLICLGIFLAGNWFLSGISIGRYDLTEGKIYTISESSKKILRDLKVPVTAKYYVSPSDKMPSGLKTLEQDVLDKLEEMRVASHGKFQYKVFHMEAANVTEPKQGGDKAGGESLEEQLQKKGIEPFQVRAIESDEVAVRLVYSAMTLAYKEKNEEMIPRITTENLHQLEYLVVSKIFRMTLPESPKITIVAPYEEKQMDPQVASLLRQLGGGKMNEGYKEDNYELLGMALQYEGYEATRIKSISEETPIPEGTKTLIFMEPTALNDRQRYEIDEFLNHGGSLLLAVQNYSYNYEMGTGNIRILPSKINPAVNPLLSQFGFEVDDHILVDEQHDMINLSGGARMGPFEVSVPVKVPIQILINDTGMNPNISITSHLSPLFYLWGTAIKVLEEPLQKNGLNSQTLLSSSANSWTVPPLTEALNSSNLMRQPESREGPFPLAVFVQGQFPDLWKDKMVPAWPASEKAEVEAGAKAPEPPQSPSWSGNPAPGKMILIGAATPFQKSLLRSGGHLNFFLNAVDALTLGDQLISIRSKQMIDRSIHKISAPSKIMWRFLVNFLVPVVIAFIGFSRSLMRRRTKQNYLKELALAS